jgi:hypothetical protein
MSFLARNSDENIFAPMFFGDLGVKKGARGEMIQFIFPEKFEARIKTRVHINSDF